MDIRAIAIGVTLFIPLYWGTTLAVGEILDARVFERPMPWLALVGWLPFLVSGLLGAAFARRAVVLNSGLTGLAVVAFVIAPFNTASFISDWYIWTFDSLFFGVFGGVLWHALQRARGNART